MATVFGKVAGKVLPAIVGGAVGGAVKGGIGAAATIAGSTIEAVGSTLGGALQGMLTQPDQTNVSVTYNLGGAASNESSPIRRPDPAQAKKPSVSTVNSSMSMEQLLGIAVEYLSSIDATLRNQNVASAQALRIKGAEDRERKIENPMGVSSDLETKTDEMKGESSSASGSTLKALALGIIGAGGIAAALDAMKDDKDQSAFTKAFKGFLDNIEWIFAGAWGLSLIKGLAGSGSATAARGVFTSLLGNPITWAVAGAVGTIWGFNEAVVGKAWDESKQDLDYLEKNYGMKRNIGKDTYTINGKEYSATALPEEYQTILDAYGPLGDGRSKRSADARERIEKTQKDKYDKLKTATPTTGGDGAAYNTVFGNGKYGKPTKKLTDMTVGEVIDYQKSFMANGAPHSPMGAYQINRRTLLEHAPKLFGDDYRNERFSEDAQDKLGKRIYEKQGFDAWEAPRKKGISDPGSWEKAKPIIVSTETGGGKSSSGGNEYIDAAGDAVASAKDTLLGGITPIVDFFKKVGQTDSKGKPLDTAPPDYSKYRDLYKKNLEADVNMTTGGKKAAPQIEIKSNASDSILRGISGTLDVINPNYNLSENGIISQYISFFGYGK